MNIKFNKNYLIGALLGLGACFLSILIFSGVMLVFKTDKAYAALFATVSVALGAYISSFYIARKNGSKGYLSGIAVGLIYFAVITVLSAVITKSHISSNTAFHFVIILLSSVIGGIMGVNKRQPKI